MYRFYSILMSSSYPYFLYDIAVGCLPGPLKNCFLFFISMLIFGAVYGIDDIVDPIESVLPIINLLVADRW